MLYSASPFSLIRTSGYRTRSLFHYSLTRLMLLASLVLALSWPAQADTLSIPSPEVQAQIAGVAQQAFSATNQGDFATAETYWSQIIELDPSNAPAWTNRGNARVSQNKLEAALADYNQAVDLAPQAPDPYLNRGTALEGLGRWQEALADYQQVLQIDPEDPAAFNNRGNAEAGLGQWQAALQDYAHAIELAPDYSFAQANYALTLYQVGQTDAGIQAMRGLVKRYPKFPDMRAALSVALFEQGRAGEAQSHWVAAVGLDPRYGDSDWVTTIRRWPPRMIDQLNHFLGDLDQG